MHDSTLEPENDADPVVMAGGAEEAARILRAMANENRLMVLCCLGRGELSVSELLERIPLSQSALSQHLAMLRKEGVVDTRREAQAIYYRVADERVQCLMSMTCQVLAAGRM